MDEQPENNNVDFNLDSSEEDLHYKLHLFTAEEIIEIQERARRFLETFFCTNRCIRKAIQILEPLLIHKVSLNVLYTEYCIKFFTELDCVIFQNLCDYYGFAWKLTGNRKIVKYYYPVRYPCKPAIADIDRKESSRDERKLQCFCPVEGNRTRSLHSHFEVSTICRGNEQLPLIKHSVVEKIYEITALNIKPDEKDSQVVFQDETPLPKIMPKLEPITSLIPKLELIQANILSVQPQKSIISDVEQLTNGIKAAENLEENIPDLEPVLVQIERVEHLQAKLAEIETSLPQTLEVDPSNVNAQEVESVQNDIQMVEHLEGDFKEPENSKDDIPEVIHSQVAGSTEMVENNSSQDNVSSTTFPKDCEEYIFKVISSCKKRRWR
ncbi:hypothetical protein RF11_13015 [Thelohanellus kitauei]|uniref:Uncharacterized protein n=1 Tax=Thelohanellus kitauei TaxID=669202 RepID=A0A0C2MRD1_THEKT|nr:hypothetical protein RF11_13015 [Thelohanellus kitauei]